MYGKMQEFGLIEIIPFMCISVIWGQYPVCLKSLPDFPGDSNSKESACYAGDAGLILGSGRSPEQGNGNQLQNSCLENPMDRGAGWATESRGHKESDMTDHACTIFLN